jgi:hypothetical protein
MERRSSIENVEVLRAFKPRGAGILVPAGLHSVETEEEMVEGLSFPAWRRVATTVMVERPGLSQRVKVDPAELAAATAKPQGA